MVASQLLYLPAAGASDHGKLRLRGRLQTRFEVKERVENGDQTESWTSRFRLRRARVDGRWDPTDWASLVLEIEGAATLDLADSTLSTIDLKDAYGRFRVFPALVFQLGQFKKPFSRLKMTSAFDLLLPSRGLLNKVAVGHTRHGGFGGRAVGAMVSGRVKKWLRLRYWLGMFSGPRFIDEIEESSKDFVARIQVRPFKGLRVAIDASHKLYHFKEGATLTDDPLARGVKYTTNLFGADARLKIARFTLLLEGAIGDNVDLGPGNTLWGFHATTAYSFSLREDLALVPALMIELFDPSNREGADMVVRLAGAVNLDIGDICRFTLFADKSWGRLLAYDKDEGGGFISERPATRVLVQVNIFFE